MPTLAAPEFQETLKQLAARAGVSVATLLRRTERLDAREAFAFITDAYPKLLDPFLSAAGELTTQWYAEQPARPVPAGKPAFSPVPAPLITPDRLAISARWALTQPTPAAALEGSATRAVFDQSRTTVIANVKREGVRWARYASRNACGFCRMLATRGAVYHSERSALAAHDRCFCMATPDRDGNYEPPEYVAKWEQDYEAAFSEHGSNPDAIAKAMNPGSDDSADDGESEDG